MANYATNVDLQKILPTILSFGVSDWTDQLTLATADVLELIKVDWFRQAANDRWGLTQGYLNSSDFPALDEDKLDTTKLVELTCYRALAHYIMPILTNDAGVEDQFFVKMERYQDRYKDEWDVVKRRALYDFDGDGNFDDVERFRKRGVRFARA